MRRPIQIATVAAIILLLVVGGVLFQKLEQKSADYAKLQTAEQEARARYSEAFDSMAEIQDSLSAITVGEGAPAMRSEGLQSELALKDDSRRAALERIAVINASIQRAKERIQNLESTLKKNGTRIAGLERMLAQLKKSVATKEEQVAVLTTQVDSLRTEVAHNQETIVTQQQTIEQKQDELATVYYTIGSKQDLTKAGVVVAKGGVLGLGKTIKLSGDFSRAPLTPLDTDQQTTLSAPATKAQVLSPQPVSSYELRLVGNQMELHILDPTEFRKVRHLVIMTS